MASKLCRTEVRVATVSRISCCAGPFPTADLIVSSYKLYKGMLRTTCSSVPVLELLVPCCIYSALTFLCILAYIERWSVHWRRRHDALMKNRTGQKLLRRKCRVCERGCSRLNTIGGGAPFDHCVCDLFFPCTIVLLRQL